MSPSREPRTTTRPPPRPPSVTVICKALEQPIDTPAVRAVACAFRGTDPTVHYPSWHRSATDEPFRERIALYQWKTKGAELDFLREADAGAEWRLATVWLYDEGVRGFSRYKGDLPVGVAFGAPRARTERAVGEPTSVMKSPAAEPWTAGGKVVHAVYKREGMAVSYLDKQGKEPVVIAVGLFEPNSAPHAW